MYMAGASRIHWAAPAGMLGALFVAFFFALGHHLFYASLAGTAAPTGTYDIAGASISRQQLNTAIGTAFGFLVKSFLSITISIAFVQSFWRVVRTSKDGQTLTSLDGTYTLLSNFLGLFKVEVWKHFPIPLTLAFIAWCVPIASIITPATLSVHSEEAQTSPIKTKVPDFDFTSLNFAGAIPEGPEGYCFNGPSQAVKRVAVAVAAQGQTLPIPAPAPNATWSLDFWAPSLTCNDVEGSERTAMLNSILNEWGEVSNCSDAYGFLAWMPTQNSTDPFVSESGNASSRIFQDSPMSYDTPASIYVATLPQMFNFVFMQSNSLTDEKCRFFGSSSLIYTYPIADDVCLPGVPAPECYGQQAWFTGATLLRCDLMNSSYSAAFTYSDGVQKIDVTTNGTGNASPISPHQCFNASSSEDFGDGKLTSNATEYEFDEAASKLISYQSIAYAFNKLLLGSITMGGYSTPLQASTIKTPGTVVHSNIVNTILMDTEELAFVTNFNGVNESFSNLQMQIGQPNSGPYVGISSKMPTGQRGALKPTLEMLFQNITMSLLAEEYLLPNYSSPYAPPDLTEVTFQKWHNVYIYSARTLWLAYGLAMLFTIVAIGLGISSMMLNNASFRNDFSTILRTVRAAPMSVELLQNERDGRQPLPKRLAKARVMIGSFPAMPKAGDSATTLVDEPELATVKTSLLLHGLRPTSTPL